MRADDKTLWAIGVGEYDRNGIPLPIPVEAEVLDYDPEHPPPFTPAIVEPETQLIKGHNRVGVLTREGVYSEVVLHEQQAYIQPMMDREYFHGVPADHRITNVSIGWQHTLITCSPK